MTGGAMGRLTSGGVGQARQNCFSSSRPYIIVKITLENSGEDQPKIFGTAWRDGAWRVRALNFCLARRAFRLPAV